MQDPRSIHIADYAYDLPDNRIAKHPLARRDASKLLVYRNGDISEAHFADLPDFLPARSLVVMNNTRVIQARLHFRKDTGAKIEVFCLEPAIPHDYALMFTQTGSCTWHCLVGNSKKWKEGSLQLTFTHAGTECSLQCERAGADLIRFTWSPLSLTWAEVLEACGELPIPPYLNRATEASDLTTYQTVYSKVKGSVAAPTAGLHFTPDVLASLDAHGIERAELTLHVGAGTFKPVKSEELRDHDMHTEWIAVPRTVVEALLRHGGECTAIGTTSVRTLESLYYIGVKLMHAPDLNEEELTVGQWEPYLSPDNSCASIAVGCGADAAPTEEPCSGLAALRAILAWMDARGCDVLRTSTQIIIAPGYTYHIVRRIVTNFHQPQSTLLLLVSAFVGGDRWRDIYRYALDHDFRFLSYGDSSLLM